MLDSSDPGDPPRRVLVLEMVVVLCLGVFPSIVNAMVFDRSETPRGFVVDMLGLIAMSLQVAVPLLYIMWRSRTVWSVFGLGKPRLLLDGLLALLVLSLAWNIPAWVVEALSPLLYPLGSEDYVEYESSDPVGLTQYLLLVVAMLCNSIAEELVMRSYLITRLRQLGMGAVVAVLVTSALFASYHVYQGVWVVIPIAVTGIIFGASFVLTGRILPAIVAHTLLNLIWYLPAA